jgi:hypothetical protein
VQAYIHNNFLKVSRIFSLKKWPAAIWWMYGLWIGQQFRKGIKTLLQPYQHLAEQSVGSIYFTAPISPSFAVHHSKSTFHILITVFPLLTTHCRINAITCAYFWNILPVYYLQRSFTFSWQWKRNTVCGVSWIQHMNCGFKAYSLSSFTSLFRNPSLYKAWASSRVMIKSLSCIS